MNKLKVVELYAGALRSIKPFRRWKRAETALLVDANGCAHDTYPDAPCAKKDISAP